MHTFHSPGNPIIFSMSAWRWGKLTEEFWVCRPLVCMGKTGLYNTLHLIPPVKDLKVTTENISEQQQEAAKNIWEITAAYCIVMTNAIQWPLDLQTAPVTYFLNYRLLWQQNLGSTCRQRIDLQTGEKNPKWNKNSHLLINWFSMHCR